MLHTDNTILISTSEEFRASALLGRRKLSDIKNNNNNNNSDNNGNNERKSDEGSQLLIYLMKRLESDELKSNLYQQSLVSNMNNNNDNNENIQKDEKKIEDNNLNITSNSTTSDGAEIHRSYSLPINSTTSIPHSIKILPSDDGTSITNIVHDVKSEIKCNCSFNSTINNSTTIDSSNISIDNILHCCTCSCHKCILPTIILTELRELIVKLLFLEFDSYKWYSDAPIPYFLLFASRFDKLLNPPLDKELYETLQISNNCIPTKYISDLLTNHIFIALKIEIEALTRILLYFPSGGAGSIPEEFRRIDPEGMGKKWQIKEYDLDDDGIVIID